MSSFHPSYISQMFNHFAGREVPLVEKNMTYRGQNYTQLELKNSPDPVLEEMRQLAEDKGLTLRVWWPGVAGTMDIRNDRVNAHIQKDEDGKWRVAPQFSIG
jgi:hypothetical protein